MFINTVGARYIGDDVYIRGTRVANGKFLVYAFKCIEGKIEKFTLCFRKKQLEEYGLFLVKGCNLYVYDVQPILTLLKEKRSLNSVPNNENNFTKMTTGIWKDSPLKRFTRG